VQLVSRQPLQYSDALYMIEWHGNGYAVIRKSDRQVMSSGHQGEAQAIVALNQLYARRVA
jgi:hypothetical protein